MEGKKNNKRETKEEKAPRKTKTSQVLEYTVLRDDREKHGYGWYFQEDSDRQKVNTVVKRLKTGDYTVKGYEGIFTIERKGSVIEFATNVLQKRFKEELVRMKDFDYSVVILEFSMNEMALWPRAQNRFIKSKNWARISAKTFMKMFWEIRLDNPHVDFIFAEDAGKETVTSLLKRLVLRYEPR